jgi:prephenate dehydrogenase
VELDRARRADAADDRADSLDGLELVVLATPLDVALKQLAGGKSAKITSTCSVMAPLRAAAGRSDFVAGHPFAGSEKSGLEAARGDLFEGKPWFVDRDDSDVRAIIEACGAKQVMVEARRHDETMALTSHLPQMISTALASLIEQKGIDPLFIGSGVRSVLRLAGSSHEVWAPVLDANQQNIAEAAEDLGNLLELLDGDDFERAQKLYRMLGESKLKIEN